MRGVADLFVDYIKNDPVEVERCKTLMETLGRFCSIFRNRVVLDFGAAYGLSACILLELGATRVIGVEPDAKRVQRGIRILQELHISDKVTIVPVPYIGPLPFVDSSFEVVLANAVLEHIPTPRAYCIEELWRVLAPGGFLIVNESPNKYLPIDFHTTGGLWFIPWLPRRIARAYAISRGRFKRDAEWDTSGWKGIGYYEIANRLRGRYKLHAEITRLRHRIFAWLGLPPPLLDPYPTLIFEKLKR